MSLIAKNPHPFEPRFDGKACRVTVAVVDHRPVECGGQPGDNTHTGTRHAPPELEFPYPPCSICGEDTNNEGDGFFCEACGVSWSNDGRNGSWDEPETKACTSTHKPFDRDDLASENEKIRHFVKHCIFDLDHDGDHDAGDYTTWTDDQAVPA